MRIPRHKVENICNEINVVASAIQDEYSGISNTASHPCFGIILATQNEVCAFMVAVGRFFFPEDAYWLARHARIDHVDTEIVLYFPGAQLGA